MSGFNVIIDDVDVLVEVKQHGFSKGGGATYAPEGEVALDRMRRVIRGVAQELAAARPPDAELELGFGLRFDGGGGVILCEGDAETHLHVRLRYSTPSQKA